MLYDKINHERKRQALLGADFKDAEGKPVTVEAMLNNPIGTRSAWAALAWILGGEYETPDSLKGVNKTIARIME